MEEATAAARSMEQQAGELVQAVSAFRLDAAPPVREQRPTALAHAVPTPAPRAAAAPRPRTRRLVPVPSLADGDEGNGWRQF